MIDVLFYLNTFIPREPYRILPVHVDPSRDQVPDDGVMPMAGCPAHGAVPPQVHHPQIGPFAGQHFEDFQLSHASCDMYGSLAMLVG